MASSVRPGPDGRLRCGWGVSTPDYIAYHDEEWGRPLRGDTELFELMMLEAFQSGLSWLTILRKREAFRKAFEGFDPATVAAYGKREIKRLMGDAGIVRNRAKIEATINNAEATLELQKSGETFTDFIWSFAPARQAKAPRALSDLEPATAESKAMSKELKRRGFAFVGPTTAYSLMESAGLVNDHLADCAFRDAGPR